MTANAKNVANRGINIVPSANGALVILSGPIDIDSSPVLRDGLHALLQPLHEKRLIVDLSAVTHIDSSGIATLIEALKIARGNKTELTLQGLQQGLLHLLQAAGILALFNGNAQTVGGRGAQ
jgi:anti-sigma B factor antagonist